MPPYAASTSRSFSGTTLTVTFRIARKQGSQAIKSVTDGKSSARLEVSSQTAGEMFRRQVLKQAGPFAGLAAGGALALAQASTIRDVAAGYEYLAETLRSLIPAYVARGWDLNAVDLDTLADRLRNEITAANGVLRLGAIMGAWSRMA
jgi:hypothetical protein